MSIEKAIQVLDALSAILAEHKRAREKWPPMASPHEGYAILLEEVDELWEAVKRQDASGCRKEAIQVGAMILAFLVEVAPMVEEAQDLEGRAEQDALEGEADAIAEGQDRDRHDYQMEIDRDDAARDMGTEPEF